MPGCVLRAAGVGFRVDEFLQSSPFTPCDVYRRGEPRGRGGRLHEKAGFTVVVSNASGDELDGQVEDALRFLRHNQWEVSRLLSYEGVEEATLDFGVRQKNEFGRYFYFPPELLRQAGNLALGIELSVYAGDDDEQP
jgi:hypothetical protein